MAKKAKAKKKSVAELRKELWARQGYEQLFVRLKVNVLEVLDEHVAARRREDEAKGWSDSKYTRTQAVTEALQAFLGLAAPATATAVSVDQLTLPGTESRPRRVKAVAP